MLFAIEYFEIIAKIDSCRCYKDVKYVNLELTE